MLVRRSKKPRGWTNPDGSRKDTAPPHWPFGVVKSKAQPRLVRNPVQFDIDCKPPTQRVVDGNDLLMGVGKAPW